MYEQESQIVGQLLKPCYVILPQSRYVNGHNAETSFDFFYANPEKDHGQTQSLMQI